MADWDGTKTTVPVEITLTGGGPGMPHQVAFRGLEPFRPQPCGAMVVLERIEGNEAVVRWCDRKLGPKDSRRRCTGEPPQAGDGIQKVLSDG